MRALALACLVFCMSAPMTVAGVLRFDDLSGWDKDDHRAALSSFLESCDLLTDADWRPICAVAHDAMESPDTARQFFELFFRPVVIGTPPALLTGYFEPELQGSPTRTGRFRHPIYRRPPELQDGQVFHSRADIENGALSGRGLELAWLDDAVDAYFLQVQGSGRIKMPDGRVMRVGYAGRNGHGYKSVGQEMVRRGAATQDQVSAQAIADHVRAGSDLLSVNPSYVFFREIDIPADKGPLGAMGRSITAMRSIAIDPDYTPLGVPVWVEKAGRQPFSQLMVAQDTGGAIKGAQRADIFYGTGKAAGDAAGVIKDDGRLVVLLPIDRAYAMAPDGF